MKIFIALLPTIFFAVYGQLVTKWRVSVLSERVSESDMWERLLTYVFDPFIISAYVFTFAASLAWMFVVEKFSLSLVYPLYIGITIVVVTLLGILLFREPLTLNKAIAIAFILTGVAIGVRSG